MLVSLIALASPGAAQNEIPLLKAGLTSQNYEVSFVAAPYMADISFHRQGRFFIVGRASNDDVLKFDATGQMVVRLKYSGDHFRPRFSPYVTTRGGIYDLSQETLRLLPITRKFNRSKRRLSRAAFVAEFSPHYARADVVVLGDFNAANAKYAIYLRTGGKWTIFYISPSVVDFERDDDLGNTIAAFPPKFERMVLLSDPVRKRYSYSDRRLREREIRLPEDKLRYGRSPSLKRTSYRSSGVFETIPYTPIPGAFAGIATYRLTVGGEKVAFRERAVRGALRARATFNMSLFVVPKPYDQEVPVSFLEFRPISNVDTLGSDGLYIIRPRR
ncbi:MAG: hypothetical protein L3J36_04070 [Rhodobacteraceae bacterium]|nr:hypothetical protein [Paracoccaceae bacterium]